MISQGLHTTSWLLIWVHNFHQDLVSPSCASSSVQENLWRWHIQLNLWHIQLNWWSSNRVQFNWLSHICNGFSGTASDLTRLGLFFIKDLVQGLTVFYTSVWESIRLLFPSGCGCKFRDHSLSRTACLTLRAWSWASDKILILLTEQFSDSTTVLYGTTWRIGPQISAMIMRLNA